jgi:hypothetical protein
VKQLQRYGRTFALGVLHSARTRLEEAAVEYVLADAEDQLAFLAARGKLTGAAVAYVLSTARDRVKNAVREDVVSTVERLARSGAARG